MYTTRLHQVIYNTVLYVDDEAACCLLPFLGQLDDGVFGCLLLAVVQLLVAFFSSLAKQRGEGQRPFCEIFSHCLKKTKEPG